MKHLGLFSLVLFVMASCSTQQTKKGAFIRGKVLSGKVQNVSFRWIDDNPITGTGETYTAPVDSHSNFSIEIPIERIATGRIHAGNYYHNICLLPGDDISVSIDGDLILFTGKGAGKNNFIYQTEKNGLWDRSFYAESNKSELAPKDFLKAMIVFKNRRIQFLNDYADSVKLQKKFIDFYRINTQVIFENLIQNYPRRYAYVNKIPQDSLQLPEEFHALNAFANYIDDSKVISSEYLHNLRNHIYNKAREISKADTSIKWHDAFYVALFDSLSGKTQEYLLTKWIVTEFSHDKYDTTAIEKFNEIEKDKLAKKTFNQALNKYNEKRALIGHALNPEFSQTQLTDTSGVQLSFEDMMANYKGKVVYLDFWSMGCGPCRAAMPYSKKLKEKLADKPVAFVYISLDPVRKQEWAKVFKATFTTQNLYVMKNGFNSKLYKFMQINWVPCYMIFDKDGQLFDFNADRPSRFIEKGRTKLEETLIDLATS